MSERDAVLFANEAFYRAFADRDTKAMDETWARDAQVSCIHPGWPPLYGRASVMRSWQGIMNNPASPAVQCLQPNAMLKSEMALVVCFEEIDGQYLIASNVFVKEGHHWRLAHHQAGPTNGVPEPELDDDEEDRRVN